MFHRFIISSLSDLLVNQISMMCLIKTWDDPIMWLFICLFI